MGRSVPCVPGHSTKRGRIPPLNRGFWILLLASFPLLAAAANPCTPAPRVPGTPIEAPHAVFEAYVVEVHAPQVSSSTFGVLRTRRALVEVVRSFHGPYSPGQQVETLTIDAVNACGGAVESGSHVLVASEFGGAFEIVELLPKAQVVPQGPFAALAYATGEPRRSLRRSLKNAVTARRNRRQPRVGVARTRSARTVRALRNRERWHLCAG